MALTWKSSGNLNLFETKGVGRTVCMWSRAGLVGGHVWRRRSPQGRRWGSKAHVHGQCHEDPNFKAKYGGGSPRVPARHAETQAGLGWLVLPLSWCALDPLCLSFSTCTMALRMPPSQVGADSFRRLGVERGKQAGCLDLVASRSACGRGGAPCACGLERRARHRLRVLADVL